MSQEIEKQIAHHEKEACQWVEVAKTASSLKTLLLCIEHVNNESKEVARLVAKKNGWGETLINHL